MPNGYTVGCYYFPNFHVDPRNEQVHGNGWSEWQLVKNALPRFPGHNQPKVPLWGYGDEADPAVMEKKINSAADHGIDFFIFDWYYYDDGPFLQRCLDQGYLKSINNDTVKFCCMWANHDWFDIHPAKRNLEPKLLYPGKISSKTFHAAIDLVINKYFKHPSHFLINGCPYFSFYEISKLLESFGGIHETAQALSAFRRKTIQAGFPDLHLNAVVWGSPILPGENAPADPFSLVKKLGFDSITSYVWMHHVNLNKSPYTQYEIIRDKYLDYWDEVYRKSDLPYFPNVSVGWDPSPRTDMSDKWIPGNYPYTNLMTSSPADFKTALKMTKEKLAKQNIPKILNINSWNEWTEGSYLEPDTINKFEYLEAVREVFKA